VCNRHCAGDTKVLGKVIGVIRSYERKF